MGTSYYATLLMGAEVDLRELQDETRAVVIKCPTCQEGIDKGTRFCAECGNSFVPTVRVTWKPAVLAALQKKSSYITADEIRCFEPPLFSVGPRWPIGTPPNLVAGIEIAHTDSDSRRPTFIKPSKIVETHAKVLELFREMGLAEREISLISYVLIC